jgi:exonuclease 3'-5' domain-containing protein 1
MIMASVTFIATTNELSSLLSTLDDLPVAPPSLYIDLEGAKLSHIGTVFLLTLYVLPEDTVYIIDIHSLGAAAFSTPATVTTTTTTSTITAPVVATALKDTMAEPENEASHITMKSILECSTIRKVKVFFDVRNDSDALFAHFNIQLKCIHDIPLMKLTTTTRPSRDFFSNLSSCIRWGAGISYAERMRVQSVEEAGTKLFAPERGGSYDVFNERPLRKEMKDCCVRDVVHMSKLWKVYHARSDAFWKSMVKEASDARGEESRSKGYVATGEHKRYRC